MYSANTGRPELVRCAAVRNPGCEDYGGPSLGRLSQY
jgi:hypothetical protein